jgi:hypothetical protein
MTTRKDDEKLDKTVEDSFPASDPPASSGITGPRLPRHGEVAAPDKEARPKGRPTDERHAAETANHNEGDEPPRQR